MPSSVATVAARQHFLKQNGRAVFKFAVTQMVESVQSAARSGNGLTPADIAMVVPHQANQRILDATAERLGVPHERVASVLARYGNTTAATLPLALDGVAGRGEDQAGRPSGVHRGGSGVHVGCDAGAVVLRRPTPWKTPLP